MSVTEAFSNSIDLEVINEYDKGTVIQISMVLGLVYHVACQRVLSNGAFETFILTTFSESVISKLQNLLGHLLDQNVQNFIEI